MSLNQGSVILVIVCTLAALMVMCTSQWFRLTTALETIALRESYDKKFRLTEALLNHTISLCCKNYDQIITVLEEKKEIISSVYPWPPHETGYNVFTGIVTVSRNKNVLFIKACIKNLTNVVCAISCNLERCNDHYIISSWSRG